MKRDIKNSPATFSSGMSSLCTSLQNNPFILSPRWYKEPAPCSVCWGSAGVAGRIHEKPQPINQALPCAFISVSCRTSKPFP